MYISGHSSDGKSVLRNVFYQYETNGVPLDLLIEQFYANGYLIDWLQFYDDAVAIGWKCETILKRIGYAFEEVFSLDESERIIASLKRFRTYPTVSLMKTLP